MATIIIRRNSGLSPASNIVNAARQIVGTGLSQLVRGELMEMALGKDASAEDFKDIRNKKFNSLMMEVDNPETKTKDSLEFLGAKIDVTSEKTVISTPVTGRVGTVKELVCGKDYVISISGMIYMDSQTQYPLSEIKAVNDFFNVNKEIAITNDYLNSFGIYFAIFSTGNFDQSAQKYTNMLPFKFRFISDEKEYGLLINQ